jgi:hypothetical protein
MGEQRLTPLHLLSLGAAPTAGPHRGIGAMARSHAMLVSTIAANLLWQCAEWWQVEEEMKKVKVGRG